MFDNKNLTNLSEKDLAAIEKKKKLWRNLFLLNACVSVILVGIFWLPSKLMQMDDFLNSPSVNLPEEGKVAKSTAPAPKVTIANQIPSQIITVNASSEKDWAYFDFSRGSVVQIHDPSSLEWDLAFRRGKVISNGGATNKFGKAGLLDLKESDFDVVAQAPLENYIEDVTTKTETQNPILLKWYSYNYLTHKLTAKKNIYAVRTADSKFAKVQFMSFYCENKETGCIKMRYSYQGNGSNSFLNNSIGLASSSAAPNPAPQDM
jgi:heme-binding HmuY-like protein